MDHLILFTSFSSLEEMIRKPSRVPDLNQAGDYAESLSLIRS